MANHKTPGRAVSTRRRLRAGMAAAVLPAVLLLSACGGGSDKPATGSRTGATITGRLALDPTQLDPHQSVSAADQAMAGYLYDGLVNLTADGKVVSGLAAKWDVTATKVVFTLRTDPTCADGTKVTPTLVKRNFDRLKDPATKSPYTSLIFGGSTYDVTADDAANTVTVTLPAPNSDFIYNVSGARIICPAGLDNPASLAKQSAGTGPFTLVEAVSGDHYTLATRKGYTWGPDGASTAVDGFPGKVVLKVISNDSTATNLLLTGGLDFTGIVGADRQRLASRNDLVKKDLGSEVFGLFFNQTAGRPSADPAVRRALAQAVSRADLNQAAFGQFGKVPNGFLLDQAPCNDPSVSSAIPTTDAAAAKGTLSGKDITLKVLIPDVVSNLGELLQKQWTDAGVKVDLSVKPAAQVVETLSKGGDWDVTTVGIGATSASRVVNGFFVAPPPPAGANFWHVNNTDLANFAKQATGALGDQSCKLWNDALKSLLESVDALPYGIETVGWFSKNVEFRPVNFTGVDPTSLRVTR